MREFAGRAASSCAAFPRRADQPQPARDARDRCAGDPGALPAGPGRRRAAGADLTRLSPDRRVWWPDISSGTASPRWSWARPRTSSNAGVPRFLFSDFPLGNSCGKPHEPDTQRFTLDLALKVLESADRPAHHGAVAVALDRGWRLEERLQQPRAHAGRGGRQAPRRVRQGEADGAGAAQEGGRGVMSSLGARHSSGAIFSRPTKTRHWSGAPQP